MSFLKPVSMVRSTALNASSAKPCASDNVLNGTWQGRHTVEITAVSKVYIGGEDVTTSNGRPINAGETITIPVVSGLKTPCYVVGGNCIITEYF